MADPPSRDGDGAGSSIVDFGSTFSATAGSTQGVAFDSQSRPLLGRGSLNSLQYDGSASVGSGSYAKGSVATRSIATLSLGDGLGTVGEEAPAGMNEVDREASRAIVSLDVPWRPACRGATAAIGCGILLCLLFVLIPQGLGVGDGHTNYWVYSMAYMQLFTLTSALVILCEVSGSVPGMPRLLQVILIVLCGAISVGSFYLLSSKYCNGEEPTGDFKTFMPFIPACILWLSFFCWAVYLYVSEYRPAKARLRAAVAAGKKGGGLAGMSIKEALLAPSGLGGGKMVLTKHFHLVHELPGEAGTKKRMFDPRVGLTKMVRLQRNPVAQWFASVMFVGGNIAIFEFCVAEAIGNFSRKTNSRITQLSDFAVFVVVVLLITGYLKFVGYFIDRGKTGGASLYIAGQFIGLCNYYIFLRALFVEVAHDSTFAALIFMHCFTEVVQYPVRMSTWYYHASRRVISALCFLPEPAKALLRQDSISAEEWTWRLCLDYSLRVLVMLMSLVCYVGFFALIRFGYNAPHFPYFSTSHISEMEFERLLTFLCVTACCEIVTVFLVKKWIFKKYDVDLLRPLRVVMSSPHLLVFLTFSTGAFLMNIFVARADTKTFECAAL